MSENSTTKKESFTPDHGFVLMEKWPPFIRWFLVLPVRLLSFILINGLTNWALKISDANWFVYTTSFIFHTLASAIFIYYGAATAPKGRNIVMIILALLLIASGIIIFTIPQERNENVDLSLTLKIINVVSIFLGIALVYFGWIKNSPNVEKPAEKTI